MKNFEQLKNEILKDGVIDAKEVQELKDILYSDGIIDVEEAEFLFELNDAVSGNHNHSSWTTFFVDAICSYLLDDENSPGEIDKEEAAWLYDKIKGDSVIDEVEKKLLLKLKTSAKSFPENLESLLS